MPRFQSALYSLNGGEVSQEGLSRLDLQRLQYAGELYQNIFPKVIGSMQLRGGFAYRDPSAVNEAGNVFIPFVVGSSENALLQFSSDGMRIFDGDTSAYLTRASVSTSIQNGDFNSFAGWSDESTGGASAGVSGGNLVLDGASGSRAIARQQVTVSGADQNTEHGVNVTVINGPVILSIGTTSNGTEVFTGSLEEGSHSIGFTPGATTIYVNLSTAENRDIRVDNCVISSSGQIVVNHPYSVSDFRGLKYDQSNDVIFVASDGGFQQRRIERRGMTSWSIVRYKVDNGPFDVAVDPSVGITPSATTGNITLTASEPIFDQSDVGSLFRLTHFRQLVTDTITASGQTTESIRVTGVNHERIFTFTVTVSGDFDGEIILERAAAEPVNFSTRRTFTGSASEAFDDELDNQITFYRFRGNNIVAGSAAVELDYSGGQTRGVARVTSSSTSTVVNAEVLVAFGDSIQTTVWDRGSWSDRNGWPNAVTLFDGRLWWGRGGVVYGSVSDAFDSYDDETVGDSAPVIRSVDTRSLNGIEWLLGLQRLAAGAILSEVSIRASSFDEPITATNFVPREASTRGCADVAAVKVDSDGIFLQRSLDRLYRFFFDAQRNDYYSADLTELNRDILEDGVVKISIQRHPDTRIWCLTSTGELRCLVFEIDQSVIAWCRVVTDGIIEDFDVIPSDSEDRVFAIVRRNIDGSDVRYVEEMASLEDANGGLTNRVADSYVTGTNSPASTTINGLSHLEGEQVIVWGNDGSDNLVVVNQDSMLTVSGGSITVPTAVTDYMVGLPYVGRWKSTRLAYGSAAGTSLSQRKRVSHMNLIMQNIYRAGIRVGKSFTDMVSIRKDLRGRFLTDNELIPDYDYDATQMNNVWDTDDRIHIEMRAPYSATVNALVLQGKTNDQGG